MSNGGGVQIPVTATFNQQAMQQQLQQFQQMLNQLGQQIAQANRVQFNPISPSSIADMQKMQQQFETLLKLNGDLRNRVKNTGQQNSNFFQIDWNQLYPDVHSRNRQMRKIFEYVTQQQFGPALPQPPNPNQRQPGQPGQPSQPAGPTPGGIISSVTQSALQATNPVTGGVGGVASNALGMGMRSGFGAGLMGLAGGLLALGVGKLVGTAAEYQGQAEDKLVGYDRLKRILGDVGVSFDGLKSVVESASQNLRLKFGETTQLASEYARLGNLGTGDRDRLLMPGGDLYTSVGMARAYGLDPSQTTGVFGTMRGLGVTKSEQDTRRFAMLIGETIGKSNAFAKAGEVMDALANYASSQVRNNLGTVNTAGYAGMLSSMVGSGIAGLDPSGAGSLLARVNASLMAGGAKGEASQFFTAMLGSRMGLNPIQTQMMREGGAFSTKSSTFGPGSIWERFMGRTGPAGGQTMLQAQLGALRRSFGSNKGLLAQATANHLGINMAQAMALHLIKPNQMGEMQRYTDDITKMSSSGIGNLSKALYGTAEDRAELIKRFRGDGRSSGDKDLVGIEDKPKEEQRRLLAALAAKYGQEETDGSNIRDTKNLTENIKNLIGEKLIPLTQEIRHGIISMAGMKGMSYEDIMKDAINAESGARTKRINSGYDSRLMALQQRYSELRRTTTDDFVLQYTYRDKPDVLAKKQEERKRNEEEMAAIKKKIAELETEKAGLLTKENERRKAEIAEMEKQAEARRQAEDAARQLNSGLPAGSPGSPPPASGGGGGGGKSGDGAATYSSDGSLFSGVINQESGGRHFNRRGEVKTSSAGAIGIAQVMPGTGPEAARLAGLPWDPVRFRNDPAYNRALGEAYFNEQMRKFGNDPRKALAAYNAGPGATQRAVSKAKAYGGDFLEYLPAETQKYVPSILNRLNRKSAGTKRPPEQQNSSRGNEMRIRVDPLDVIHRNDRGEQIGGQQLATRIGPSAPFGTESYA